jgi:subtilisin family serine protease
VFAQVHTKNAIKCLNQGPGLRVASSSDFVQRAVEPPKEERYAMYFETLGIAVLNAPADQLEHLGPAIASGSKLVRERYTYLAGSLQVDASYLRGLRDGVDSVVERLLAGDPSTTALPRKSGATLSNASFTWNLDRVGMPKSAFSGRGVKVAILDTGYDSGHPDFRDRAVMSQSFVPGSSDASDRNGHGTHCLGTACGLKNPSSSGPRYGCASEADILVGKVIGDDGHGEEEWVLNGINWALEQGADIVSLSIETRFDPDNPFLPQYEAAGSRALDAGRLLIAAAGNHSVRPIFTRPVASPASAPSIMAVAAIGPDNLAATFSCAGGPEGEVDIAAPGVAVESSFLMPRGRKTDSGTSMAAPLVAGIAALHKERDRGLQGRMLWDRIVGSAERLTSPAADVGAGCVLAP